MTGQDVSSPGVNVFSKLCLRRKASMHVVLSQDMSLLSNVSVRGGKVHGEDEVIVVRCGSVLTRIAQYWVGQLTDWWTDGRLRFAT